jgi:hypothetical protein
LGFVPSRVLRREPGRRFRVVSSHALLPGTGETALELAPQSIDRLSLGLAPLTEPEGPGVSKTTLLGFLHRVDPAHSSPHRSGLCVHLALMEALLPPAQCALDRSADSTAVAGTA